MSARIGRTGITNMRAVGDLLSSVTRDKTFISLNEHDPQVGLLARIIHEWSQLTIRNSLQEFARRIRDANLLEQITNRALPSIVDALGLYDRTQSLGIQTLPHFRAGESREFETTPGCPTFGRARTSTDCSRTSPIHFAR
jgi:hypothetical protein